MSFKPWPQRKKRSSPHSRDLFDSIGCLEPLAHLSISKIETTIETIKQNLMYIKIKYYLTLIHIHILIIYIYALEWKADFGNLKLLRLRHLPKWFAGVCHLLCIACRCISSLLVFQHVPTCFNTHFRKFRSKFRVSWTYPMKIHSQFFFIGISC